MYNQQPWRAGNFSDGGACEECQCYGHATACNFDPEVAKKQLSLNVRLGFRNGFRFLPYLIFYFIFYYILFLFIFFLFFFLFYFI